VLGPRYVSPRTYACTRYQLLVPTGTILCNACTVLAKKIVRFKIKSDCENALHQNNDDNLVLKLHLLCILPKKQNTYPGNFYFTNAKYEITSYEIKKTRTEKLKYTNSCLYIT